MEKDDRNRAGNEDREEITIEPAVIGDAEAIREIQVAGWMDSYPSEEIGISRDDIRVHSEGADGELINQEIQHWRDIIAGAGDESQVFVARQNGKVVGFVSPYKDDETYSVGGLYVAAEVRGRGIGSQLLQKALDFWGPEHDVYVYTVAYNDGARRLYERAGFTVIEESETEVIVPSGKRMPNFLMIHRGKGADAAA